MSVEAMSYAWQRTGLSPAHKLALIWISGQIGGLEHSCSIEWCGFSEFMGVSKEEALEIVYALIDAGELLPDRNEDEDGTWSEVWLAYGGPYQRFDPWEPGQAKSRKRRLASLIGRDGAACVYCDASPPTYEIDHFHPRAKGGPDTLNNLVLACQPCNRAKRDKLPEHFLAHDPDRFRRIRASLEVEA